MLGDGEVHFFTDFACDRSYFAFPEATGIDELEGRQVGIDIEGEAVHRDVATALHTDGADLALTLWVADIQPDTCSSVLESSLDLIEGKELNNRLLK